MAALAGQVFGGARLVPWHSWEEWRAVYKQLFDLDHAEKRDKGVQAVQVWKTRASRVVPLAVDLTSTIVLLKNQKQPLAEHATTLALSMAITRLVNGLIDPLQQKARAQSIKKLASELALPTSLVEIRHEATHNRLPSLQALNIASDQALLWLHQSYWLPQLTLIDELQKRAADVAASVATNLTEGRRPQPHRLEYNASTILRSFDSSHFAKHLLPALLDSATFFPPIRSVQDVPRLDDPNKQLDAVKRFLQLIDVLQSSMSQEAVGGLLLVLCSQRIVRETDTRSLAANVSISLDKRLWTRRELLCACASYVLQSKKAQSTLRVTSHQLLEVAAIIGGADDSLAGDSLLRSTLMRREWPHKLRTRGRRLLDIRRESRRIRRKYCQVSPLGIMRGSRRNARQNEICVRQVTVGEALHKSSIWSRCEHWQACALGEMVQLDSTFSQSVGGLGNRGAGVADDHADASRLELRIFGHNESG